MNMVRLLARLLGYPLILIVCWLMARVMLYVFEVVSVLFLPLMVLVGIEPIHRWPSGYGGYVMSWNFYVWASFILGCIAAGLFIWCLERDELSEQAST